jgi:hypothetical protein
MVFNFKKSIVKPITPEELAIIIKNDELERDKKI